MDARRTYAQISKFPRGEVTVYDVECLRSIRCINRLILSIPLRKTPQETSARGKSSHAVRACALTCCGGDVPGCTSQSIAQSVWPARCRGSSLAADSLRQRTLCVCTLAAVYDSSRGGGERKHERGCCSRDAGAHRNTVVLREYSWQTSPARIAVITVFLKLYHSKIDVDTEPQHYIPPW